MALLQEEVVVEKEVDTTEKVTLLVTEPISSISHVISSPILSQIGSGLMKQPTPVHTHTHTPVMLSRC